MTTKLSAAAPPPAPTVGPHNFEIEQQILGELLIHAEYLDRLEGVISVADFFDPLHGRIFDAITKFHATGKSPTPLILADHFKLDLALKDLGGAEYLVALVRSSVGVTDTGLVHMAIALRELADRRRVLAWTQDLAATAEDIPADMDVSGLLADFDAKLQALPLYERVDATSTAGAASQIVVAEMERHINNPGLIGVTSGLDLVDQATGGWRAGNLIVLGARPGVGKSLVGGAFAFNAARAGHGVVVFSLEMSPEELLVREIASVAYSAGVRVAYNKILPGDVDQEQAEAVMHAELSVRNLPVIVDAKPGITADYVATQIKRHARTLKAQGHALGLVIVDHLHLMAIDSADNATVSIGLTTAKLKAAAKAANVPVILLAQLNRESEKRGATKLDNIYDSRPTIPDLRQSGNIEQDADLIGLLFRPELQAERLKPKVTAYADSADYNAAYADWFRGKCRYMSVLDIFWDKMRMGEPQTTTLFVDVAHAALRDEARK